MKNEALQEGQGSPLLQLSKKVCQITGTVTTHHHPNESMSKKQENDKAPHILNHP